MLYAFKHLDFTEPVTASSQGVCPKAYHAGVFYKAGNFNPTTGFYGYSAYNDVIASRYLRQLGLEVLTYDGNMALIQFNGKEYTTYVNWSADYRIKGEDVSVESLMRADGVSPEERVNYMRMHGLTFFDTMLVADFLIGNRDRHGGNIRMSGGKFTPLFDFNLSMFMPDGQSRTHHPKCNNFIGSPDLDENLALVTCWPQLNFDVDWSLVFQGMDYPFQTELAEWLEERMMMYEEIRHCLG